MDGDGSITPPGTPGGQGADPTDAPGAYDSPVNTVPLWNANAVVPGAPRADSEIAESAAELMDMYARYLNQEDGITQTVLRVFLIRARARALDAFHSLEFSRRVTPEWTTLADMVVQGLNGTENESEETVTFWLHHCSTAVRVAFRARHPGFNPRPLPFHIYVNDGQGNLDVLPPRDDTRRVLSFPGGAGLLPSREEILEDQKALTQGKRKRHEDGRLEREKFRASEGGEAGFDNTSPPSPAPCGFKEYCETHGWRRGREHGCRYCQAMLEHALDSDNEDIMFGEGDSLPSYSDSEAASEGDPEAASEGDPEAASEGDHGSDDGDWVLETSFELYSDADGEDGF